MAWEISISAEGWQEIRAKLDQWDRAALIAAITDDTFERVEQIAGQHHAERAANAEGKRHEQLPHDVLADRAYELIEQNNTCENGGYGYWVDREGYHKVWLD
jgi:hypothetical protein